MQIYKATGIAYSLYMDLTWFFCPSVSERCRYYLSYLTSHHILLFEEIWGRMSGVTWKGLEWRFMVN